MWKWFTSLLLMLFLVGCAQQVEQAQEAYAAGNYQQSIRLLTEYLDKEGKMPSDKEADRIFAIIANVVDHYKSLAENRSAPYASRIEGYQGLLFVRKQISYKFYEPYVYALTQKYNVTDLSNSIAEQYYLWGSSIKGESKEHYRQRAELFKQTLEYGGFNDAQAQYSQNHEQYATMQAHDSYQLAKQAAAQGDYKTAAEGYLSASAIFEPYGSYKDSQALGIQYDKRYRKDESNRLYQQAMRLSYSAYSRANYREVASVFQQAHEIYEKYGQVNDAKKQYMQYYDKGLIKIYLTGDTNQDIEEIIQAQLKADYVKYVSSPMEANITISVKTNSSYWDNRGVTQTRPMSEYLPIGKEAQTNANGETVYRDVYRQFYFNKVTFERRNRLTLTAELTVKGEVNYPQRHVIEKTSYSKEISYSGDIPPNSQYKAYSEGQLKSEYTLHYEAKSELALLIKNDMINLASRLKNS